MISLLDLRFRGCSFSFFLSMISYLLVRNRWYLSFFFYNFLKARSRWLSSVSLISADSSSEKSKSCDKVQVTYSASLPTPAAPAEVIGLILNSSLSCRSRPQIFLLLLIFSKLSKFLCVRSKCRILGEILLRTEMWYIFLLYLLSSTWTVPLSCEFLPLFAFKI